jgi:hypothetical protein
VQTAISAAFQEAIEGLALKKPSRK